MGGKRDGGGCPKSLRSGDSEEDAQAQNLKPTLLQGQLLAQDALGSVSALDQLSQQKQVQTLPNVQGLDFTVGGSDTHSVETVLQTENVGVFQG